MAEIWLEESDVPTAREIAVLPARYAELRAELVRAVRRVCPSWLAGDADDLVQEAMLRVMQSNDRRRGNLRVTPAYLRKVAYCAVVDEMRRRQRAPGGPFTAALEDNETLPDEAQDLPDRTFIGSAIGECLARLNGERRRALTLHLLGHSVAEAARVLDCKSKRAENLIYRGLAQLRDCLAQRGLRP